MMKKITLFLLSTVMVCARAEEQTPSSPVSEQEGPLLVHFSFQNKTIIEIVKMLVELKKGTFILPEQELIDDINRSRISYKPHGPEKLPLPVAYGLVQALAKFHGFMVIQQNDTDYTIVRLEKPSQ